jgi:phenylpropionate dioxygenase-like ring-hydroxylating dioxygenase large terminal subunit
MTPVALSPEIGAEAPIPAVVGGVEIVLWRGPDGAVRAWEDRCPHRGMRLSFGFIRGEHLACLYHGWRWRADGGCAHIPAHPDLDPPATLRVNAFACAERDGLVWLGEGLPPALGTGPRPVRSLTIAAPCDAVAAALGGWEAVAPGLRREGGRWLAMRAKTEHETTVHLLSTADAIGESRWAEGFRAMIEAAA